MILIVDANLQESPHTPGVVGLGVVVVVGVVDLVVVVVLFVDVVDLVVASVVGGDGQPANSVVTLSNFFIFGTIGPGPDGVFKNGLFVRALFCPGLVGNCNFICFLVVASFGFAVDSSVGL